MYSFRRSALPIIGDVMAKSEELEVAAPNLPRTGCCALISSRQHSAPRSVATLPTSSKFLLSRAGNREQSYFTMWYEMLYLIEA